MSLEVLLEAAEYIERRDREMEHGYAITLPPPQTMNNNTAHKISKRTRVKSKIQNNRTTHNELEKNRRAHLRNCLEKLKEMVPLGPDGTRHTTLGLLTRAKLFINNLEDRDKKQSDQKDKLFREQRHLRRKLDSLNNQMYCKRRSLSESSSISTESSASSFSLSSTSETDEVDIMGYGSNHSDTDDHSSVLSSASDGGVTVGTRRLTLAEPPQFFL